VREQLIASMDSKELVAATESLEADEIADLAPTCQEVIEEVVEALPARSAPVCAPRCRTRRYRRRADDFDMVTVRDDVTLET